MHDDTICAIATAPGQGAIAVIRLSGEESIQLTDKVFRSAKKSKTLSSQAGNTIHFGQLYDGDLLIDEVLVSLFRAPHSYTGENSIEISCHGSEYIQQRILQLLVQQGVRLAGPGEFTMRAFLNGKLDLSQAEAVADLIGSGSEAERRMAMHQMRGGFSDKLRELRDQLLQFISLIELELDFAEEDVQFADRSHLVQLLQRTLALLQQLSASFAMGNVLKRGVAVAIAGEPNVGKSTLLNALLNEERAIVSEIAGTTRDSIEDTISLQGVQFRFIDTAGIRQTSDTVESIGIERAFAKIDTADVVLLLVESSENSADVNTKISEIEAKIRQTDKSLIVVINKVDRTEGSSQLVQQLRGLRPRDSVVAISAKYKQGIDELIHELLATVRLSELPQNDVIISNIRHYEALTRAAESLERALQGIEIGLPTDLLAEDIRQCLHYLGEITGEITTDEILGNIFSKFCIGK